MRTAGICGFLCGAALWAQGPELSQSLKFEDANLRPWNAGPTVSLDDKTVHSGKGSARIDRPTSEENGFSGILRMLPMDFVGKRIEMRGFLRTENVSGFVGMWMREDGEAGSVAFDNMQKRQLNGTHDWDEYSISLPVNMEGRRLFFGVFVQGTGTAWVDDLQLLVDGKPIWEAPKAESEKTSLDTDHEFDAGSGIALEKMARIQVENLIMLGKVWGFLKYHHPAVTAGQRHWDYDLFRVMPEVLAAADRDAAARAMSKWVAGLGPLGECKSCATLKPDGLHLRPELEWLKDEERVGSELGKLLQGIYANRPADGKQFYLGKVPGVGNPDFRHELGYANAKSGDAGMQILAAFRYWNIVEYWFPYRNVIGEDWEAALRETLPKIALAKTVGDYHRELMALIARAHDTHSNLWSSLADRPPVGTCQIPVTVRFVEGQWVITDAAAGPSALRPGDVLTELDGTPLAKQVEEWKRYYADSNDAAMERDMARQITRGPCGETTVKVRRATEEMAVKTSRVTPAPVTAGSQYHDVPGDAFRKLGNEVAYIKISTLKKDDVKRYVDLAAGTKGLIIDLRNYPSDFPIFDLGQRLVNEPTPFVHFTTGDLSNPGAFYWQAEISLKPQQPHYAGNVVILVDEVTQSSAEYHAMAFRRAPGAKVVGSTTAGADGNVSQIPLPGGLRSMISGIGVFYPDLKPTQRVGIVPDVVKRPTIVGIKAGRDEVLEEGIRQVLGRELTPEELAKMLGR